MSTVNLSASSTDSMGATATDSASVTVLGSAKNKAKVSMMKNRIVFGSPLPGSSTVGPTLFTDTPNELGVSFWVKCEGLRVTGLRIYKHPLAAGSIPVTLWDDAGTVMATTTVTWVSDNGGWREIPFSAPSAALSTTREYRATFFAASGHYVGTLGAFEAQDTYEWPFLTKTSNTVNGVIVGGGVFRADTHGVPTNHFGTSYYVDVLGEVDMDTAAYTEGYMGQWSNYTPTHAFPVGVFYSDPEFIEEYASIGVNTMVAVPGGGEAYRNAILNSDVDVWASMPDIESLRILLSDPELAARIRGWFVCDEPDLAGTWKTPEEIRAIINMIRGTDSTRPIMINFGFATAMRSGWFYLKPGGKDIVGHFDELIEDMNMADVISLDYYNVTPVAAGASYGPWTYYTFITALQQMSLNQKPVWGYVETASPEVGYPTPAQVEQATWSSLIGGAKGIVFFDHQFPTLSLPLDFATILHKPDMKTKVQAMSATIQAIAGHLKADEAHLVTSVTSSNTTAPMRGATMGVPIQHTSRIYGGQSMVIAQGSRPGATTATFTVPSAASKTITVYGESRTLTANGSGVFTDSFAADYAHHIYTWTP